MIMGTIFELQRWLYTGALEALNAMRMAGVAGLPALIGAAFGFGMLHALLPGHGKSVLASYYAGDGRFQGALGSSTIMILTHVGSAVVLVLSGFVILQRTIGSAGRAGAEASRLGDAAPESLQGRASASSPAFRVAVDQHRSVHRAGRRAGNAVDSKPGLLQQTIEDAPGKRPMRAFPLQPKIDKHGIACDGGLGRF
jgi:hypothetical protein